MVHLHSFPTIFLTVLSCSHYVLGAAVNKRIPVPAGYVASPYYPAPHGGWTSDWSESYRKASLLVSSLTLAEKTNITAGSGNLPICVHAIALLTTLQASLWGDVLATRVVPFELAYLSCTFEERYNAIQCLQFCQMLAGWASGTSQLRSQYRLSGRNHCWCNLG